MAKEYVPNRKQHLPLSMKRCRLPRIQAVSTYRIRGAVSWLSPHWPSMCGRSSYDGIDLTEAPPCRRTASHIPLTRCEAYLARLTYTHRVLHTFLEAIFQSTAGLFLCG